MAMKRPQAAQGHRIRQQPHREYPAHPDSPRSPRRVQNRPARIRDQARRILSTGTRSERHSFVVRCRAPLGRLRAAPKGRSSQRRVWRRCRTAPASPGAKHGADAIRRHFGILMLPYADDLPAESCEQVGVCLIPSLVPKDLCVPVGRVRSWTNAVAWAAVPKASVDEHGNLLPCEDDVGPWR